MMRFRTLILIRLFDQTNVVTFKSIALRFTVKRGFMKTIPVFPAILIPDLNKVPRSVHFK